MSALLTATATPAAASVGKKRNHNETSSVVDDSSLDDVQSKYMSSLSSNGVYFNDISIQSAPGEGLGLFANKVIPSGQAYASAPLSLILTEKVVINSTFTKKIKAWNEKRIALQHQQQKQNNFDHNSSSSSSTAKHIIHPISPRTLYYLFLIHAWGTSSSFYHPWLRAIPQAYDDPLWWLENTLTQSNQNNADESVDDKLKSQEQYALDILKGTNLEKAVANKRRLLKNRYDK